MKTVSMITLFSLSLFAGYYFKRRILKREKSLKSFLLLLENISTRISFSNSDINEIISDYRNECDLLLLENFVKYSEISDIKERWKKSVENSAFYDCFKKNDTDIILSFGNLLGITDTEGQKNNCILHMKLLENALYDAETESVKKGKLITSLSLLTGVGVILLLI